MSKRILIIDDEPEIRELLTRALQSCGYQVTGVSNGREAHKSASEHPPHLIISDLQLDEGDGLEVIDDLKQLLPSVPVMLVTGVLFDADVAQAMVGGKIAAYVEKTAPLQKIIQEARRLMEESKQPL